MCKCVAMVNGTLRSHSGSRKTENRTEKRREEREREMFLANFSRAFKINRIEFNAKC